MAPRRDAGKRPKVPNGRLCCARAGMAISIRVQTEERRVDVGESVAANRINLLAGMGDVGKDVLCCTIAAIVSTGRNWPDGSPCQKGKVGYVTAEDEPDDTVVPRLIAAGANLDNVVIWTLDNPPSVSDLDGLSLLIVSPLVEPAGWHVVVVSCRSSRCDGLP